MTKLPQNANTLHTYPEKADSLKALPGVINTANVIAMVTQMRGRIEALEAEVFNKKTKAPKRMGKYRDHIMKIMSDGKIWSTFNLAEEMQKDNPAIFIKAKNLNVPCNNLVREKKLKILASNIYQLVN